MDENLTSFISLIDGFYSLRPAQQIDYFAYYLNICLKITEFSPKNISDCYEYCRLPPYSNISSYLIANSAKPKIGIQAFIAKKGKYQITKHRELEIMDKLKPAEGHQQVEKSLRALLSKLPNPSENSFLEESILTFEVGAYRAAILMVWLLTIDHLYEHVLRTNSSAFNNQLRLMGQNKVIINTKDDFGQIKESTFIEACKGAGIISSDVRKILDTKLGIRNSFAHPSAITLPKSKALEFIEDLIENVIFKYID